MHFGFRRTATAVLRIRRTSIALNGPRTVKNQLIGELNFDQTIRLVRVAEIEFIDNAGV